MNPTDAQRGGADEIILHGSERWEMPQIPSWHSAAIFPDLRLKVS